MPHYRSSDYLPTREHLGRRWRFFRTAELNAVGWAAVAGLCTAGAATGLAAARRTGAPSWITVPAGGAVAVAAVVAADRRRWAGMPTTYSWTDDRHETERVAELLSGAGVTVEIHTDEVGQSTLRYRNGDHRRVARAFRNAGLPPPPKN